MIQDLRDFPDGAELTTGICIVGAGPAGLAIAAEFADSGVEIVLLESGGFELEEAAQALCDGASAGLSTFRHRDGRARAFGGTARLWAGQCVRLDEIDFEERPWIPLSGWPIKPLELEPYYRRAEAFFNLQGEVYDDQIYDRFKVRRPLESSELLRTRFTIFVPELDAVNRIADRLRRAKNIKAVLHANVMRIETNDASTKVSSVAVRTIEGKSARVRASVFILCGGGIENARILLLSHQRQVIGLGNSRDLVGRFFQEHPTAITAELVSGPAVALQESFRLFHRGGKRYFPRFALSPAIQRRNAVLNCNAHVLFDYPETSAISSLQQVYRAVRRGRLPGNVLGECTRAASDLPGLGNSFLRRFVHGKSPLGILRKARLQCYLEQAPNRMSRILLSHEKDGLGLPKVVVDWRLTDLELRTCQVMTDVVRQEFELLGFGHWSVASWLQDTANWRAQFNDSAHHMGTTRMATSQDVGVVDPDCKLFGIDGLYISGSSVFPTSGWANPTLTIVALAIRLADHLKKLPHLLVRV